MVLKRSLLAVFYSVLSSSSVSAVFGPIGTDRPAPSGGSIANDQPPNSFFQGFSPPYPTNDWWVGYAAANGTAAVAGPFPYQSSMTNNAISFGISASRDFDGVSVHQQVQTDWSASFTEHDGNFAHHKALSWDTQTVTAQYFTGASTMTSFLVPGSPYMTFQYAGATPKFTSGQGAITNFAGTALGAGASTTATAAKFKVVNTAGTYIIYSLNGNLALTATNAGTITAGAKFNGVLRVVKLNAAGHESTLDSYYQNYPTAVATDYSFSGNTGTLSFTWTVTGNAGNLLMLTWPHHRIKLQNPNFLPTTSLSYLGTKGYMYPALGNSWKLAYALPTITWNAPRNPDSSCLSSLIAGLVYEINNLPAVAEPGDFYFFGGQVAKVSRLALIAEHVGRTDLIPTVTDYLRGMLGYMMNSGSTAIPAYETGWGGIINKAGYNNVWVDYGNGYYNDHHFHYGYILHAGAVLSKYDANWKNQFGSTMTWFMRDIINPSRADPFFPVTRCRDWFAGHSWASGMANGAGSRDQESMGEAVNGYYGALLWATVTGNTDMQNYARLLLATEQHAAQVYWHLYPAANANDRDQPYPEQALRNLVTIGNVEDWQSGAWLFWGDQKVEIAAIQILPVTPINEYMYDATWANNVYNYAINEINDPTYGDEWKSVIYAALSQANPTLAAQRSTELTTWGSGNSFSNQLYFISTRPNAGGVCSSAPGNPQGTYYIQSTTNNQYVALSGQNLQATATSTAQAAKFSFGFAPNAGTIKEVSTNQFVTADSSGNFVISAARAVASAWEVFILRQKTGAASGVYSILAASNKEYIGIQGGGGLINNVANEAQSVGFKLVPA